ncbi:PaaI family thioesterase [Pararhodobacter marinus]|uniref:Thioesterase n=1 Tax=Pararhodobacter marinus TaxID=2184063 RepID=A0A2U2C8V6_9RHOB|nr:PaaI family thioesterase [Pararhodobacter marinus]PWE28289.1 thioesterase [Pararhodobacter marinus]
MPDPFFATRPEEMPSRDAVAQLTGLEYMQAIFDGRMAGAPIAGVMHFWPHEVSEGEVAFRGEPKFEHLNPMGGLHGGWYGTLLDSALGCAVATTLPRGAGYTTLEYKVNLTRALKPGTLVECRARVQHAGRSTAVAEGTIRGVEDGKLYATGSTTCIILRG